MRYLQVEDMRYLSYGAAILGTGGGGDPYIGMLLAEQVIRDFDGNPDRVTEMDALIAYLQMLGTLVDFESAAPFEELAQEKGR